MDLPELIDYLGEHSKIMSETSLNATVVIELSQQNPIPHLVLSQLACRVGRNTDHWAVFRALQPIN